MSNLYAIPLFAITLGLGIVVGYLCGRDCSCYSDKKQSNNTTKPEVSEITPIF
jgi:hypothetical protein